MKPVTWLKYLALRVRYANKWPDERYLKSNYGEGEQSVKSLEQQGLFSGFRLYFKGMFKFIPIAKFLRAWGLQCYKLKEYHPFPITFKPKWDVKLVFIWNWFLNETFIIRLAILISHFSKVRTLIGRLKQTNFNMISLVGESENRLGFQIFKLLPEMSQF